MTSVQVVHMQTIKKFCLFAVNGNCFILPYNDLIIFCIFRKFTNQFSGRSRICRGGADHGGECRGRGSGAEPPPGSRGRAPGGGLKLKDFCKFLYKNGGQKLRISVKICPRVLSHAAMTSPKFWSMGGGGGRPVRP